MPHVYILRCSDGAYYVGSAQHGLERRVAEHNAGSYDGWTARRRPVTLVYSEEFGTLIEAFEAERRLKGWSRAKKEALIRGDFCAIRAASGSRYRRQAQPKQP
jgi:putative endonuclease